MKINPIQFNFVQSKPQKMVSNPLRINNSIQSDTVSFKGKRNSSEESIFSRFLQFIKKITEKNTHEETPEEKIANLQPVNGGFIYKKVRNEKGKIVDKIPVKADIVKINPDQFVFVHDNLAVGSVKLKYIPASECSEKFFGGLDKNYKDLGVEGDRIEVKFVENINEEEYGGIGHLADLVEVAACKKLGFEPNVVSYSFSTVAPVHYKRGKRFVPYEHCCTDYTISNYGLNGKDPNKTVKDIIENTKKGEKFDTTPLKPDFLLMYMPKVQVQELEEELKENPIF